MMRIERPEWHERGNGGPRVLVENPDLGTGFAIEQVLDRAGYDVAVCGGPDALRGHRCPLIAEGRCGLAEGADVIVHSLNPDRLEHLTVLRGLRARHPHTPLVVEVGRGPSRRPAAVDVVWSSAYGTTLIVKLALVGASGATAFLHARARSKRALATFGALSGLTALGALFFGTMLG